jgi:hypothetical protein
MNIKKIITIISLTIFLSSCTVAYKTEHTNKDHKVTSYGILGVASKDEVLGLFNFYSTRELIDTNKTIKEAPEKK